MIRRSRSSRSPVSDTLTGAPFRSRSLTSFNVLFADDEDQFKGTGE
jgi:hypothetical protein